MHLVGQSIFAADEKIVRRMGLGLKGAGSFASFYREFVADTI
ncbi:Uncharacterized protein YR821_0821 [Yersinia ruckeri]|uniref:Uncharacterized protein n=1 Tax=Yersinia ruckeri TaxID=29486 RepID=A0A0A8VAS1_YERRU|nr:hypothetical protein yruck0001_23050 [Yersinia ruckeri ATCC 29473]QTD75752.1 Uncharacterized protein YR821_0821 [Yersinia ruckeri]CEK26650.1 hypothetical protein CSF007_4410 [Yersinia ruckeri]